MSEYKRMVSYFYRYENGIKQGNMGYARIECRQDNMKVVVQVVDGKCIPEGRYSVLLYQNNESGQKRILLGEAKFQNSRLEFRSNTDPDNIAESRVSLAQCDGILVYYNNQIFYGSQWNEKPILLEPSTESTNSQKQSTTIEKSENVIHKEEEKSAKERVKSEQNVDKESGSQVEKTVLIPEEEKKEAVAEMPVGGEKEQQTTESSQIKEWQQEQQEQEQKEPVQKQEMEKNEPEKKVGIQYLLKHRNPLPAFVQHEVMRCVRIVPEDIGYMARRNWEYGNNSFVMHGYYNYRYLLLGSIRYGDEKEEYILGVPGIFSNRDQYLAGIFGFKEFVPIRTCPYKTGEFGYWIAKLWDS